MSSSQIARKSSKPTKNTEVVPRLPATKSKIAVAKEFFMKKMCMRKPASSDSVDSAPKTPKRKFRARGSPRRAVAKVMEVASKKVKSDGKKEKDNHMFLNG